MKSWIVPNSICGSRVSRATKVSAISRADLTLKPAFISTHSEPQSLNDYDESHSSSTPEFVLLQSDLATATHTQRSDVAHAADLETCECCPTPPVESHLGSLLPSSHSLETGISACPRNLVESYFGQLVATRVLKDCRIDLEQVLVCYRLQRVAWSQDARGELVRYQT